MAKAKGSRKKVAFIGAGSLGFTQKLVVDILSYPELSDSIISLNDVHTKRLSCSKKVVERVIRDGNYGATVEASKDRKVALKDADYIFITVLIDGYEGFKKEIEIPKKYGVDQAVGDTTGVGGVFRAQRTIPAMLDFVKDIERYAAPGATILNYTNPMHMLSWAVYDATDLNYVGLCHSVQGTTELLARTLEVPYEEVSYLAAGINHQAWILNLEYKGKSLIEKVRKACSNDDFFREEPVRCEMCRQLGYFPTESSPHNSEYVAWFRKNEKIMGQFTPGGISNYGMLLSEYGGKRAEWEKWMTDLATGDIPIELSRSHEYGSSIVYAMATNQPYVFNGNVKNTGVITNLPDGCCVEVPCVADANGITPIHVGDLPPHLAAINRNSVNVHELSFLAAKHKDPELVFQALMCDPLTSAVLSLQEIRSMTNELFKAQKKYLKGYKKFDAKKEMDLFSSEQLVDTQGKSKAAVFKQMNVIDQFFIIGPFNNVDENGKSYGLEQKLPPEEEIALKKTYSGKAATKVKWKKITAKDMDDDGYVNLSTICGKVDMACAYAYTILEATADYFMTLIGGSDDGIKVWLNGRELYCKEATRSAGRAQFAVPVRLKHGKNELLMKIDQKHGGWGFYASFKESEPGLSIRTK